MKLTVNTFQDITLRKRQEDSFYHSIVMDQRSITDIPLFVIGDGLGGHPAGDIASKIIVDSFSYIVERNIYSHESEFLLSETNNELKDIFNKALNFAMDNIGVYEYYHDDCSMMGSTLTALLLFPKEERGVVCHVGDSYLTLLRQNVDGKHVQKITNDHVGWGGGLTQFVGSNQELYPSIFSFVVRPKDRLLLSSDGLKFKTIERVYNEWPEFTLEHLAEETKKDRSSDNITIIGIDLE
jgi:protein phosphatase